MRAYGRQTNRIRYPALLVILTFTVGSCSKHDPQTAPSPDNSPLGKSRSDTSNTDEGGRSSPEQGHQANESKDATRVDPCRLPESRPTLAIWGRPQASAINALFAWNDGYVLANKDGQWVSGYVEGAAVSKCLSKLKALGFFAWEGRRLLVVPDGPVTVIIARDGEDLAKFVSLIDHYDSNNVVVTDSGIRVLTPDAGFRPPTKDFLAFCGLWYLVRDAILTLEPKRLHPCRAIHEDVSTRYMKSRP